MKMWFSLLLKEKKYDLIIIFLLKEKKKVCSLTICGAENILATNLSVGDFSICDRLDGRDNSKIVKMFVRVQQHDIAYYNMKCEKNGNMITDVTQL